MKKIMMFILLMLSVALIAGVNFSGTWNLDREKSTLPEGGQGRGPGSFAAATMVVTQDASTLTIERTVPGRDGQERKMTSKVTLDGQVVKETTERGSTESKAAWQDAVLVYETVRVFEREGQKFESKRTEKWSLSADGKELTIAFDQTSQRGDSSGKLVYVKK
ncbi:MAG: hypothetical protein EHM72_03755 [Calditrichaeota bacterium]|nr:MAG: hypothetical protein EHM72_03755 [Calditrichota bacterium]